MKKIFLLAFIMAFGIFSAQAADMKIGYLNFHKALNESEEGKKASKVLEDMVAEKEPVFNEKKEEMQKLDEELKKQASVLTPETRSDKEEELNKLYRDYQRMAKDFQEELQKKETDLRQVIEKDLFKIINEIGKDEGYAYIFEVNASGLLYYQEKYDITDEVIEKYNKFIKDKK